MARCYYVYVYIRICIQIKTITTGNPKHRRLLTHSEKHSGIARSRVSLPKTYAGKRLWMDSRREGSVPVRQHFVLTNARYPSLPVSLSFIAQGGRPLSPVYITLILCPFGQRYSSILSLLNICYLGFDSCTYLSTIQQKVCPRVRAGSHTLYTVCAWGRFSSRHPPPPNRASTGMCQNWVPT